MRTSSLSIVRSSELRHNLHIFSTLKPYDVASSPPTTSPCPLQLSKRAPPPFLITHQQTIASPPYLSTHLQPPPSANSPLRLLPSTRPVLCPPATFPPLLFYSPYTYIPPPHARPYLPQPPTSFTFPLPHPSHPLPSLPPRPLPLDPPPPPSISYSPHPFPPTLTPTSPPPSSLVPQHTAYRVSP